MSALQKQVGGDHYKDCKIQPVEFIHANGLGFLEGNVVKYITRHRAKGGRADIEKVIHYAELILALEYPNAIQRPGDGPGESTEASRSQSRALSGVQPEVVPPEPRKGPRLSLSLEDSKSGKT